MIYKTNSVRIKLEFVDLIKQGNCQEKYILKGWFYSLKQLTKLTQSTFQKGIPDAWIGHFFFKD